MRITDKQICAIAAARAAVVAMKVALENLREGFPGSEHTIRVVLDTDDKNAPKLEGISVMGPGLLVDIVPGDDLRDRIHLSDDIDFTAGKKGGQI